MRSLAACALALLGAIAWAGRAAGQDDADDESARAAVIRLDGPIDALTERTLEMRLARAAERKPRFVIISIDSPGGEADVSHRIAWNLRERMPEGVTTVAFVRAQALSGATFVAFGCDVIAMAPGGQLGDAMPIWIDRSGALQPEVAEKFVAPTRKDLRDLAQLQGYPGDAAEKMVDPRLELHRVELRDEQTGRIRPQWLTRESLAALAPEVRGRIVSDQVVCAEGKLLVIGPEEARDMGIARLFALDEEDLCTKLAEEYSLAGVRPLPVAGLWWEHVVRFFAWWPIKSLLFVVGLLSLMVAVTSPGHGWPEGIVLIAFGLFFGSSWLIGLADSIEVVMFLLGVALLVGEMLSPGFGVLGISGLLLLAASLLLSFQTFLVPETPAQWAVFRLNIGKTLLVFGGAVVGLTVLVRFAPSMGRLGGLVHHGSLPTEAEKSAAQVQLEELAPVGATGSAATVLRPVGKVRLGGTTFEAVAESGWVAEGAVVVVVGRRGNELVVAERPEATGGPGGQSA